MIMLWKWLQKSKVNLTFKKINFVAFWSPMEATHQWFDLHWAQWRGNFWRSNFHKLGILQKIHSFGNNIVRGHGLTVMKVVYEGLPRQCFLCKQKGHLAKVCPHKIGKGSLGPWASGKDASTKDDKAPWQPVKKKGKLGSLGTASRPLKAFP